MIHSFPKSVSAHSENPKRIEGQPDDEYQGFSTVPPAMIYFQSKPDLVFTTIVQEALDSESLEIHQLADDAAIDSWEGLYPHSSRNLIPYEAIRMMKQLLAASRDTMVYRISESHWLLLYECLKNFCCTHNDLIEDEPNGLRAVGQYKLGLLDNEAMVEIYFWDTDFLLLPDPSAVLNAKANGGEENGGPESWKHGAFVKEGPKLELVHDVGWLATEPEEYFRPGSTQYPDCGWDDEDDERV